VAQAAARCEAGGGGHEGGPPITVEVVVAEGSLQVAVGDLGLPVAAGEGGLAHDLVGLGFAEHLRVATDGAAGNRAELTVTLPQADRRRQLAGELGVLAPDAAKADPDEELAIRQLLPGDAEEITRCFWRSWGYTYPMPDVYVPERIASRLASGHRLAYGAVRADGEVVGHVSLDLPRLGARVAHAGGAVVDPRYRERGLLGRIQVASAAEIGRQDLWAIMAEPVLTHGHTQRKATAHGGAIVGVLLASFPATRQVGFEPTGEERSTVLTSCSPVGPIPERRLWAPSPHRQVLEHVLGGLDGTFELPTAADAHQVAVPATSRTTSELELELGQGRIRVDEVGEDLVAVVDDLTSALLDAGALVVHLDLPLAQPATARLGAGLGELGYVYGTWVPEAFEDGDALRLQRLAHADLHPDAWTLDDDRTRWLVDQVVVQLAAVGDTRRRRSRNRARMRNVYELLAQPGPTS
jgi:hypothetical protein